MALPLVSGIDVSAVVLVAGSPEVLLLVVAVLDEGMVLELLVGVELVPGAGEVDVAGAELVELLVVVEELDGVKTGADVVGAVVVVDVLTVGMPYPGSSGASSLQPMVVEQAAIKPNM